NLGVPGEFLQARTGLTVYAGAFLIAALCLALAGVVVFAWLRPDPLQVMAQVTGSQAAAVGRRSGRIARVLAELKDNRPARYAVVAILTAQVVMVSIMTMTPVHIAHQGGSVSMVGLTISLH